MNLVQELQAAGLTKYRIAKEVGVTWNTVYLWSKEAYSPNAEHQEALEELVRIVKAEENST